MDGASRLTHLPLLNHVTIFKEIYQDQKTGQEHNSSSTGFLVFKEVDSSIIG